MFSPPYCKQLPCQLKGSWAQNSHCSHYERDPSLSDASIATAAAEMSAAHGMVDVAAWNVMVPAAGG
jgi:hypothetical protein